MYKTAVQLYFWPGMKNTIKQAVDSCAACREDRPAPARPTAKIIAPSEAAEPMRHVGTDLFDAIGKKWIVLVDRYSGILIYVVCVLCTCLYYVENVVKANT